MTLSKYSYHCSAGETFDSAARAVYGDEKYAADLLCANPGIENIYVFEGGEILRLPIVTMTDAGGTLEPETAAPWKVG
jgi:hypothetical protein